ncbi:hypothetical protein tloyanaT_17570 [Thalassotalea loyana]|jgi:hypothetical protein|uniref:Lipoprotein n=1 Tax=Thalassotalea loyana TaxID=280483 RepID=A0ABQ6HDC0_9GAMM|nr:hypothetical protein [Thalassotalea loyana]GLX85505.1 hypothetical protein tloyanaT_17570 [Thalassotalea loyana]
MKIIAVIFLTFLIAGCSSGYGVTYATDVDGALLYCGGENKGFTPQRLYYDISKEDKKRGSFRSVECEARWISGAKRTYSNKWDLNKFPDGVMQTVKRPHTEGYRQDVEFGLKVQAMRARQEEIDRIKAQQALANLTNNLKELNNSLGSIPTVTPITGSNYNLNVLPAPNGYEKTQVPMSTVGVLRNSSITNGYKLCEYSNGRAIRLNMKEQCPMTLNP